MRLADVILRRGHLSERTLVDVCMTGERPAHLDRCDICAERAVELGRWLDDIRTTGLDEAAAAFPPERLAAQQAQILRRLAQLDRPARVIAFPGLSRDERLGPQGIRPAWVGVAAAAGLVLGLLGGQISARLTAGNTAPQASEQIQQQTAPSAMVATPASGYEIMLPLELDEYDRPQLPAVDVLDEHTPHSIPVSEQVLYTNRLKR